MTTPASVIHANHCEVYTDPMHPTCAACSTGFIIHPDEEAFIQKMNFTFGDRTFHPAEPVFCPQCRLLRRTCHRNERSFYRRTSSKSGKDIVSIHHPEPLWGESFKVYTPEEWNADDVDNTVHGRSYDSARPFFDQFGDLVKAVPRLGMIILNNENSDFTAGTAYCKNCYLINSSEYCEDCYYGKLLQTCRDSVDCSYLYDSELCYECFSVYKSYNCAHVSFSTNCRDCLFSSDLVGCKNCCLCTNLRQKEYYFENQPLSKVEYEARVRDLLASHTRMEEMKKQLAEKRAGMIHRFANVVNSEHCTGDYIENSQQCFDCFDVNDSQDCRSVTVGVNIKDCYDCSNMYLKPELCYETLGTIETYNVAYCLFVFHSQNLLYCDYCFNCHDCFGCSGLRHKSYCVFNKQYSKEEYEALVPQIIDRMREAGEWGKYFPPQYSTFGYNETLAYEYVPMTKEEALARGFHWRTIEEKKLEVKKIIPALQLPDSIDDVPEDILEWAVECEETKRPFKITKRELDFYRKQRIAIPHLHPDVRYDRRLQLRNPRTLWDRACMKCGKDMQTTYAPERPETVYCQDCYLASVY